MPCGGVRSNPIIASDLEHVNIPQLADYDPLPSGFAGDKYESTGTFQLLDFSLPEVAAADYGYRNNFQLKVYGSADQNNVDATWPYTPVDEQFDASSYPQLLPYQPLPPAWPICSISQLPDASSAHLLQYHTYTAALSFGHVNLPPNDPYQQAPVPLTPGTEASQRSAPVAILLPRQHPASVTARKTTKTADKNRFQCHKGCKRTLGRADDLRRHMKKHEAPEFKCFDTKCSKTFYRLDKLRNHAKQAHGFNL